MIEKLEFEEGYFKEEEREGFLVESMMKRAWAAQLVVLKEIDRICTKHNIAYFADFGTLLGAVRHKGFIPWDDDMDISMKRKDFQKFLAVADQELKGEYRLLTAERRDDYINSCARIVNSQEISFKQERLKEFYEFPYVVGVDIFILDCVPINKEEKDALYLAENILFVIATAFLHGEEPKEEDLCKAEEFLNVKIDRNGNVAQQIMVLIDRVGQSYREEEVEEISTMSGFAKSQSNCRKKDWYREVVYLPFENILIPVPVEYDAVLRSEYGDYMIPQREDQTHEYPFYRKQEKILVERLGLLK